MTKLHKEVVPLRILDGSDGELEVEFSFSPGTPETGRGYMADPYKYDPGSADEIVVERAWYIKEDGNRLAPCGLADHERERIEEWLDDEWERPDNGRPDADDLRDRRRDDELTERF